MISGQVPVRQMYVHDTWAARDLPVLDATVGLLEHSYMVTVTDIADKTGLDPSVVARALEAMDPIYVDFRKTTTGGDPRFWYVFKVTPEARRAVGQWPSAEALVSRLVQELSAAARQEADGEHQGLLVYAARLIGDTLRDSTLRAAEAVLEPAFGGIPVPELGQQVPVAEPRPDVEFQSLVPLPELPDLLRPQPPDAPGEEALAASPEPAPESESQLPAPELPEPEAPALGWSARPAWATDGAPEPALELPRPEPTPEPLADDPEPAVELSAPAEPLADDPEPAVELAADPEPVQELPAHDPEPALELSAPELAEPASSTPEPAGWFEPNAAAPVETATDVPDINPWPELPRRTETSAASWNRAPQLDPSAFRSPLGTWPAADADPDAADTDLDMVQARRDAV